MKAEPTKHTDERAAHDGWASDRSPADPLLRLRKQARMRRLQSELAWSDGEGGSRRDDVAGHA
jgi:hypothetical protein